jgi:putative CocE/NonD family hydrolase
MSENEISVPEDYTEEEKRSDMLSYTTAAFEKPFTITGDAEVVLYVSCDCPDTDFMVRITDVDEHGKSIKLADGVLGAKYRNGFEKAEFMESGEVYELKIRTTKISNTFKPGHRMRVTVTSSAKNFIFPNSNTKDGFDSEIKKQATIMIHRGEKNCSCIKFYEEKN